MYDIVELGNIPLRTEDRVRLVRVRVMVGGSIL